MLHRHGEIEVDIEKELDKEKELDAEVEKKEVNIFKICEAKGIELSDNAINYISDCLSKGISKEVICYAISEAVDHQIKNWSYIQKILNRYKFEGYKTLDDVKQDSIERNNENTGTYSKKFLNQFYTN